MAQNEVLQDQISLFAIGTTLIRRWRQIALWAALGGIVAVVLVAGRPKLYPASLAFVPRGSDAGGSGLASLAGQFGIRAPLGTASQQPEFYVALLQSREVLAPIVLDTFVVAEEGGKRIPFLDLFEIRGASPGARLESGINTLRSRTVTSPVKSTGIVRVVVRTEWPSVSLAISQRLLEAINAFNLRTSQGQAAEERRFVERRLRDAQDSLRLAEDRLQFFLLRNRSGIGTSPQLNSEWQRLERQVAAHTNIATALRQEYEEVRIREVRDTPTITVFESPSVSTVPLPRGRLTSVILGLFLGAGIGVSVALGRTALARRQQRGDAEANEFLAVLRESKSALMGRAALPRQGQS